MNAVSPTLPEVTAALVRHVPLYRWRSPAYQTVMLSSLRSLWRGRPERLLDIGGGTGLIGQAIADLFPVGHVYAIDITDRYLDTLSIDTRTYDGVNVPFESGFFEAATISNVLHHVPVAGRLPLMKEVRRAVSGPVYIKDHVSAGHLDNLRLAALDLIGNLPFSGMVWARYLSELEWQELARAAGYRIAERQFGRYRSGFAGLLFPNRLELTMRWEPLTAD